MHSDHFGLILAGGRSRRFGSRKALATVGGTRIIDRVIAAHREVFESVVVVTDDPSSVRGTGVVPIPDLEHGAGPLAGLQAGLLWGRDHGASGACCTPCDAPFVRPALFDCLLASRGEHAVVVPRRDLDRLEPLFAWFSCDTLPAIEEALASEDRSLHRLLRRLPNVRFLDPSEMPPDLDLSEIFFNVNTPTELEDARRRLARAE